MDHNEVEILIVEDSMDDANLTIRVMKKHNIANNLFHVKDGAEALDFIFCKGDYSTRNITEKPKLILLDLKMPKVNGIEVLEKLKSNDSTKTIPVVILTSSQEDPDIKRCYELGANSYIVKPVDFDDFIKSVGEVGLYWLLLNKANH
jgi:two-component system response regulator